ncbi:MAG: hypothetical protein AUJ57_08440 [Zetaproteobacteria bacterium CG1_02_53_45]|nr:MAG: hypothetical protein AUJ57_08440 [Zetaproteobacteria bacterium CG1_02_53_45]
MISTLINKLKKIPIDLGQESVADITEGKQIALRHVMPGQGKTALDVGARMGEQTRLLRQRGYTVTSVDVEPQFHECMKVMPISHCRLLMASSTWSGVPK